MRYPEAHAATSGSVPFALHGRKPLRTVLATAVAAAVGLVPGVMVASPAMAATYATTDIDFLPATTSMAPQSVTEGTDIVFDLTWAGDVNASPDAVTWKAVDGTAKAPTDFAVSSGTLTWDADDKSSITVPTIDDNTDEADAKQFTINLYDPADTTQTTPIDTLYAEVEDNDAAPVVTMSADKTKVTEGTDTKVTVTVGLSRPSEKSVSVPIATSTDGTAKGGVGMAYDFVAYPGPFTFAATQTSKTFEVTLTNDTTDEDDQSFQIKASAGGTNISATLPDPITVTIVDNDDPPTVQWTSSTATAAEEGKDLSVPVLLSEASDKTVTVKFSTGDVPTADLPLNEYPAVVTKDYTAASGTTLSFAPGVTTMNAVVKTIGDELDEVNPRDLQLTLSAPDNATLGTRVKKLGQINDPGTTTSPSVTLTPMEFKEASDDKWWDQTYTVKLSKASGKTQVLHWITAKGGGDTATEDVDFKATSGDVTFAPGDLEKTFKVQILADKINEGNETFTLTLSNKDGKSTLASDKGDLKANTITIQDDDGKPTYTVNDISVNEGNETSVALYSVKLSNPSYKATTWKVTKSDGTAKSDSSPPSTFGEDDYSLLVAEFTIPAGYTSGHTVVMINGDKTFEGEETASLKIEPKAAGDIAAVDGAYVTGKLTLKNDDTSPVLEVEPASGKEGDTVTVTGKIWGQSQDDVKYNVWFKGGSVKGSTAATVDDFENPGIQQITVWAGDEIGKSYDLGEIKLNTDIYVEPAETILVEGTALNNGGTVKSGHITIAASGTKPDEPGPAPKPTIEAKWKKLDGPGNAEVQGYVAPNKEVNLWGAPVGGGPLKWIKKVESDEHGYYWFRHFISWGFRFQTESQMKKSDEVTVWVNQKPYFVYSGNTKGQLNFAVKGFPWGAGQTAAIQQWINGGWSTIRSGKTGDDGAYRVSVKYASGSKVRVRGWIAGEPGKGTYPAFTEWQDATVK